MKTSKKQPAASAILFLMIGATASVQNVPAQENVDLEKILSRCAAYCEKLRSSALDFVCEERIVENVFPTRYRMSSTGGSRTITYSTPAIAGKPGRNTWRYDYQLVKKGPSIEEKRTLLEFNGKQPGAPRTQVKPRRFFSENPVFGPVGFFDRDWHNLYDYQFLKRERVLDREAVAIKVVPKTTIENKPNYGTIWIDMEDDSVLKIEVEDSSLAGYKEVQAAAKSRGLEPDFVTIHEYGVIKNGLRFPSRTVFEERYKGRVDGFLGGTKSKTEILYSEHRFFTVETDAIIK
jgi:hypothetical protein